MRIALFAIGVLAWVPVARAQQPPVEPRLSFELASVKRNAAEPTFGGPSMPRLQTLPGGRVVASNFGLGALIVWAYGLQPHGQPEGSPLLDERSDWTGSAFRCRRSSSTGSSCQRKTEPNPRSLPRANRPTFDHRPKDGRILPCELPSTRQAGW